jgi:predicted transport protein
MLILRNVRLLTSFSLQKRIHSAADFKQGFFMTTIDDDAARMRANLQMRTGKSFAAWISVARSLGTTRHSDIVAYLKTAGPMSHGYATMVALESSKSEVVAEEDPVDALFAGSKVVLRPIYDAIAKTINTFGRDIEFAPKKDYVSVRRAKQFALLQPSTAKRLDIGINLKGVAPIGKLEAAGTWNGMLSHRVRVESQEDFTKDVMLWLKQAYDQAA